MSGDQLNLDDIIARVDDEDFYPAHDVLEADVRALVAEVRRLRAQVERVDDLAVQGIGEQRRGSEQVAANYLHIIRHVLA